MGIVERVLTEEGQGLKEGIGESLEEGKGIVEVLEEVVVGRTGKKKGLEKVRTGIQVVDGGVLVVEALVVGDLHEEEVIVVLEIKA